MHFFEDKSQAKIARELNVGEATVSTTLERTKKNFEKIFEEIFTKAELKQLNTYVPKPPRNTSGGNGKK